MNIIFSKIKTEINYLFFRKYRYGRVVRRHLSKYYSPSHPRSTAQERTVVFMADGKYLHGGLADRLRCIASIYNWCRKHNVRFAINFVKPFNLEDYLVPAAYDWRLKPGELTFNSSEARAIYMDNTADSGPREIRYQRRMTGHMLSAVPQTCKQIHVYSSFYFAEDEFGDDFKNLFKPSERIAGLLHAHTERLGNGYISVSTRFLELLGDFHEPKGGRHLNADEQERLIQQCLTHLQKIISGNPGVKVLVTSDSSRFLSAASQIPEVYTVNGEIAHVDTDTTADHTKTFLDFLLIAGAATAYQIQVRPMYSGNFSLRAAQAGNKPHRLITDYLR